MNAHQFWTLPGHQVQLVPLLLHLHQVCMHAAIVHATLIHFVKLGISQDKKFDLKPLQLLHSPRIALLAVRGMPQEPLVERLRHSRKVAALVSRPGHFGARTMKILATRLEMANWLGSKTDRRARRGFLREAIFSA